MKPCSAGISAVVQIGSIEDRLALGMKRSGFVPARVKAGIISRGAAPSNSPRRMFAPCMFVLLPPAASAEGRHHTWVRRVARLSASLPSIHASRERPHGRPLQALDEILLPHGRAGWTDEGVTTMIPAA